MDRQDDRLDGAPLGAVQSAVSVNRRRFMEGATMATVAAGFTVSRPDRAMAQTPGGAQGPLATSRLPDGSQFVFWDKPLSFSKTYHVDNRSAVADDSGPGTEARPFRTISKAAQVLQAGERVVIHSGTYREFVQPARGGTGPTQMISYEAAPGAQVYIKGSEELKGQWVSRAIQTRGQGPNDPPREVTVWNYKFRPDMFDSLYNPFALASIMQNWSWLDPTRSDMGSYVRRRGLVFVDGKPLEPMEQLNELAMANLPPEPDFTKPPVSVNGQPPRRRSGPIMQEIGGTPAGRFTTENQGTGIFIRLPSGTPAEHSIEVTVRENVFRPVTSGISYIRIKGLKFQHAGNGYPDPGTQSGLICPAGGHHWIIEDNTLEWANGTLLDLGRDVYATGATNAGNSHIVRRNTVRYGGIEGIAGIPTNNVLIEDNLVEWCGWADAERGWEAAGCKFHRAKNMLFRRNVVRHMRHCNALWYDVDNTNCRITQNVFADVLSVGAAVHMEMTPFQNSIDNNIVWGVRNAEEGTPGQRGAAGSAIFNNASRNLIIAQNLIGDCNNAGVFPIVRPDRNQPINDGHTISNNIFAKCGRSAINVINTNNTVDGNVYAGLPREFNGLFQGEPTPYYDPDAWTHIKLYDLAGWRALKGWDAHSVIADWGVEFDPATLRLTITSRTPVPRMPLVNGINHDFFGKPTGATRMPGPVADVGTKTSWNADPRIV